MPVPDDFKRTGGGHDGSAAIFGKCHSCHAPVEDPIDAPFCPMCKEANQDIFPVDYKGNTSARLTIQRDSARGRAEKQAKQLKEQASEQRLRDHA